MGKLLIAQQFGNNVVSDEITATKNDVVKGKTTITSDSGDEIVTGTLELTGTSSDEDVLANKTYYNTDLHTKRTGKLADNSATTLLATPSLDSANSCIQMTIPKVGKYSTTSKVYSAYSTIRSLINLTAAKLANGQTILGLTGTYKGLGNATVENVLNSKTFSTSSLSNATGTMPNKGAVSASLNPGGAYTIPKGYHNGAGKITAKNKNVKMISAIAFRGFNAPSSEFDPGPFESSFTLPADGVVYYSGSSASYNSSGVAVCEICKNGAVVDQRNIDSSNRYTVRGTMHEKSFPVIKGDVVTVKASVASGSHMLSTIDAIIVYFT